MVFDKIAERVVYEVGSTKKTISASVSVDEKVLKLHRSAIALIHTSIRNDVTPDLVAHSNQK